MTDAHTTTGFAGLSDEELCERMALTQQTVLELEAELRRLINEGFGEPTSQYLAIAATLGAMLGLLDRFDREVDHRKAERRREARVRVTPTPTSDRRGW